MDWDQYLAAARMMSVNMRNDMEALHGFAISIWEQVNPNVSRMCIMSKQGMPGPVGYVLYTP